MLEDGWISPVIPAHGLHEVCGVREGDAAYHADARSCVLPEAGELRMGFRIAQLTAGTARPRASFPDGTVAVTEATYGSGRVIYLAGSPGYVLGTDTRWSGDNFLRWLGLHPVALGGLQRVRRISEHGTLDFIFNYA